MRSALLATVLLMCPPLMAPNAQAEPSPVATGNSFLAKCDGALVRPAGMIEGLCLGFVIGAEDLFSFEIRNNVLESSARCQPAGVTYTQLLGIFLKYLKEHPEQLHLESGVLYAAATSTAFPCAEPSPTRPRTTY